MWKTLRINNTGNLEIATKVWSDFSAAIPLIRSFSFGGNFPPEYPLFAGPPIKYHFAFFFLVGMLEKIGFRLDLALNLLSSLSFFALLFSIYIIGKVIFNKKFIGVLSAFLFLFNGSFSFLEFFKKYPLSLNTPFQIIKNNTFPSFGPYDNKIVSAFWNLNIFTNQRHLAFAYASFLFLLLLIYKYSTNSKKLTSSKTLLLGIFIGLFPFIHLAVFGMMGILLITCLFIYPKIRKKILTIGFIAVLLAVPQILYMGKSQIETEFLNPGYLIEGLSLINFIKYWFLNLGLTLILFPIGLLLSKPKQRIIILPFLTLFIVGNLFQFSPEIAANHKFFNLFVIGVNFFTTFLLVKLWKNKVFGKIITASLLLILTLSGIIDIFPIFNDRYVVLKDYPNDPSIKFIVENTPKDAVFLNSSYIYYPASLAGRKIFMGWPYFPWSAGYDTHKRGVIISKIYSSTNKNFICNLLDEENIDFFTIEETRGNPNFPTINVAYFNNNFSNIFKDNKREFYIFDVNTNCNRT
jgi:hypothetical protein